MTAPAQSTKDWIQTVYIQITPRPKDHKGEIQADEITMASSYGQVPVVLKQPAPDRPRPKTKEPRLPGGVHVTCDDPVLVCNIEQTGCAVYRLSQARASKQTPGLPDLIAFTPRHTMLLIETKRPGGRLRDAQRKFAERVLGTMGC